MRVSIVSPLKNEVLFCGYSIMALLPYVEDIVYACAKSDDGTDELLDHIKAKYAGDKLVLLRKPEYDFNPDDQMAYNKAFNDCIETCKGESVFFCHPDMLVHNPEMLLALNGNSVAYYTNLTSYAGDFCTKIVRGRATKWKNIHVKKLGLHYFGGYGSQNEDFYHSDITGKSYNHFGDNFRAYPYKVTDSGLKVSHYCELKPYKRRFEKMKSCLKTLYPKKAEEELNDLAKNHPRVSLEKTSDLFGNFEFEKDNAPLKLPDVINRYRDEFQEFNKNFGV